MDICFGIYIKLCPYHHWRCNDASQSSCLKITKPSTTILSRYSVTNANVEADITIFYNVQFFLDRQSP